MLRTRLTLALLASVTVAACGLMTHQARSFDVSDQDGRLFVGGVPVDYHREVTLQGELDVEDLTLVLVSQTGPIDVVGGPGDSYELVVDLYSEFEGDGDVVVDGGVVAARSQLGGAVLVNGIRGRLPEGVDLDVRTATGDTFVTSFVGRNRVVVESGTGVVHVSSSEVDSVSVDAGTGDVRMTECTSKDVVLRLGVGSFAASGCVVGHLDGDSGTGDFLVHGSRIETAVFASSVGDVWLTDTLVSEIRSSLGTGKVEHRTTVSEDVED